LPSLWYIGLGAGKKGRVKAQKVLEKVPGYIHRVIAALSDKKEEIRRAAAEWLLVSLKEEAIEPIKAALRVEKSEAIGDLLFRALEKNNVPLDEFLNRDELLEEA